MENFSAIEKRFLDSNVLQGKKSSIDKDSQNGESQAKAKRFLAWRKIKILSDAM